MRNKKTLRVLFALFAVILCMMAVPMTAYAGGGDETECEPTPEPVPECTPEPTPIPTPEPTPEPTPAPEPLPLTPPGNLTLVDDVSGEQADDKQFITVVTKSGNYFYLVIDRADDKENVHFLNLVDEADLMAIIEGDKKQTVTPAPVAPEPVPEPEPAPEPETKKANSIGSVLIVLLLLGALGGGAFYYFKVLKPKQAVKGAGTTELDEFSFDEDEEDLDPDATGGEPDGIEFEDDIPDFTTADDSGPEIEPVPDFSMNTGADAPESEDNQ